MMSLGHPCGQLAFLLLDLRGLPLGRAGLSQHPTGAALGHPEPFLEVPCRLASLRSGHHFLDDLLEHLLVQGQFGDETLEAGILGL
jgi:hypothetical protein